MADDIGRLLYEACAAGDEAGVAGLLRETSDTSVLAWADPKQGWTALHVAAEMRHADIISALLAAGAPVDARDHQGWTPLCIAVDADSDAAHQEMEPVDLTCTELLLAAGADPDAALPDGQTPLTIVARYHCPQAVRALEKRRRA